jgi:phage terminase Nu1 subunit (DNA packaging protein)
LNEKNESKLVSSLEVAKIVGKTERHIQLLAKEGALTTEKKGQKNVYNLHTVIQEYIGYLAKKESRGFSSLEDEKLNEEILFKRAKARIAQLECEEIEGTMHRAEDVEIMTNDLVFNIRSMLMALPGRLAVDLATLTTPAEISARIQKEVNDILVGLAQYKYDPEEYQRRVKDRQGWNVNEDNEED